MHIDDKSSAIIEIESILKKHKNEIIIDFDQLSKYPFSFHIYRTEEILPKLNYIVPVNRQIQHYIALVRKGQGKKRIDLLDFEIKDNMLIVVPSRTIHSSVYQNLDARGYFLTFNLEFFLKNALPSHFISSRKILSANQEMHALYLNERQADAIAQMMETLLNEYNKGRNRNEEYMAVKLLELLIVCDEYTGTVQKATSQSASVPSVIQQFNELLEKYYKAEHAVQFYADRLNMHPNTLNQYMKADDGQTVKEKINYRLIADLKYYLHHTNLTVKEISYEFHFNDPNYFSSFFRKYTGMTPLEFKAQKK